jgi:hypothetical protein
VAPGDFNLFTQAVFGQHAHGSDEVKKTVTNLFSGLTADFYEAGIQKLIKQYDKCLNLHGDYVEK